MGGKFRTAIFLHHSTGANIYGLNGSSTKVPDLVKKYNQEKGFTGTETMTINERAWPTAEMGWDNEWYRWKNIIDGNDKVQRFGIKKIWSPYIDVSGEWNDFLKKFPVIIIKSCFPSSDITSPGSPSDTSDLKIKSIENYKFIWRHLITYFKNHPENFFVIWTNAPLAKKATTFEKATNANAFCTWAKDTLASGMDPVIGSFPKNVYVFDFFKKLADEHGILKTEYATSDTDSHPNNAAVDFVAPIFVKEVLDAALAYEGSK